METQDTPIPTPQPQPELPVRRRRRHPVDREEYFIDWSKYRSIWHLPNRWIAEALGYSISGIIAARHREAPEGLKEDPTDLKACLAVTYPLVEGWRWDEDDILNLLIKIESLESELERVKDRAQQMEKALSERGVDTPAAPEPAPKTWNFLRWILGGGLAAASVGILIALLTGGAK